MAAAEPGELKRALSVEPTEELIEIWTTNDRDEYSSIAFDAIKEVLIERKVAIPPQNVYLHHPIGKYKKFRIRELGKRPFGVYRGRGTLLLRDDGIQIKGKHVFSLGVRWVIGIALVIGSGILTGGALFLGFLPIYLLVEYVFLKKQELTVPWGKIRAFAVDPKRSCVGIAFDGPPITSPIMYVSGEWCDIMNKLRKKIPEMDCTPQIALDHSSIHLERQ